MIMYFSFLFFIWVAKCKMTAYRIGYHANRHVALFDIAATIQ